MATKAELVLKKRALAAAAFQHVPPVRIPDLLQKRIDQLLSDHPEADIERSVTRMESMKSFWADEELASSRNLRPLNSGAPKTKVSPQVLATEQGPIKYIMEDAVAYVAKSMPSSYAALYRVLSEIKQRLPKFKPRQILDFGSGPGTSIWAIRELWPEQLQTALLVENSAAMSSVCTSLMQGIDTMPLIKKYLVIPSAGQDPAPAEKKNDLVIASFSMNELPSMSHRMAVVNYLWGLTSDMLVIVEQGNLHGSALVRRLRERVMVTENHKVRSQYRGLYIPVTTGKNRQELGVHVFAPCAHDGDCPMSKSPTGGICGMVQAMQAKEASKLDKVTFSFVVLRRGFRKWGEWPLDKFKEGTPVVGKRETEKDEVADLQGGWLRVLRPTIKLGHSITVPVCAPVGRHATTASLDEIKVMKDDDVALFSLANEIEMGDLWPR